jgi:hypothetical protein
LTIGKIALQKELSHLETSVRELELAAQINLSLMDFYETSKRHKEMEDKGHTFHH